MSYKNWAKKCKWNTPNYNYVKEDISFYSKWKEFEKEDRRIHFVRYIDMLNQPEEEYELLEHKYGLQLKALRKVFGLKLNVSKVSQSSNFSVDKQKYYQEKAYLTSITPEELDEINDLLPSSLLNQLGYAFVERESSKL